MAEKQKLIQVTDHYDEELPIEEIGTPHRRAGVLSSVFNLANAVIG